MKRILLLILIFTGFATYSYGAGSCTLPDGTTIGATAVDAYLGTGNLPKQGSGSTITVAHEISCVADAAAATFPDVILTGVGGALDSICIDWGATAPTSGAYDIYVKSAQMADIDLLGGVGVNLATTADLCLTPLVGAIYRPAPFYGNLTISQAGNAVNSATPTITLNFIP